MLEDKSGVDLHFELLCCDLRELLEQQNEDHQREAGRI